MKKAFLFSDLRTWLSLFLFTGIVLALGIGEFQNRSSLVIFIGCVVLINWTVFGFINWFFIRIPVNKKLRLEPLKPLLFAIVSAGIIFFVFQVQIQFALAFFLAFLILGIFWSALLYLLDVLDEFQIRNLSEVVHIKENMGNEENNISFHLLSVKNPLHANLKWQQIICFEADDNYVTIYFTEDNQLKKCMERLSIRQIQAEMEQLHLAFIRVHKSYLVNRAFIKHVVGKAQNHKLILAHIPFEIPVSRSLKIHELTTNH